MRNISFFILLVGLASCYGKKPQKTGLEGKPMPSFDLLLPDSMTTFSTGSIPEGQPVVLYYFGPNCPYSKAQMKEIVDNIGTLRDIRFYVFTTWPFDEMKSFYEHYELKKYPNIITGLDYNAFFVDYFKAQGVPYMAIYGKDKKLNKAFVGKVYSSQIKSSAQ
jgi:thiol-disulfide isomerase/thioredoxin